MAVFKYSAVSQDGQRTSGEIEADSKNSVLHQISDLGYMPIHVEQAPTTVNGASRYLFSITQKRPRTSHVSQMTRELAMLVGAGMPLERSLEHIEMHTQQHTIASLVGRVRQRINDGQSFHTALEPEAPTIPVGYRSMIRVAEESGTLAPVLERIAEARERAEKLQGQVRSALIYPAFLVATAIAAVLVMLLVVVPRFKQLLATVDASDAVVMLTMIDLSDWLQSEWRSLLIASAIAVLGLAVLIRRRWVRDVARNLVQRTPVIGEIFRSHQSGVFCRTLGTLLENGVQLAPALELTAGVLGRGSTGRSVLEARDALRSGKSFVIPLERSGAFTPAVTGLLDISLSGGTLAATTSQLADRLEGDLELKLKRFFTILEPTIIILVSIFVAAVIISILNAVLSVNDLVS